LIDEMKAVEAVYRYVERERVEPSSRNDVIEGVVLNGDIL
jgi:hypothetical protein